MKLTSFEISLFIAVPLLAAGVMVGDTVAVLAPHAGLVIRWSAVGVYSSFAVVMLWRKARPHPCFKFMADYRIAVGWTQEQYRVDPDEFNALVAEYLTKAETVFPGARTAVEGCTVIFREPVWYYGRRHVEGLQDHSILSVGWKKNLVETSLRHELGHRILQVLLGDPPEEEAHRILFDNNLL